MITRFKLFESNSDDFQIGDIVIYSYMKDGKKYECEIIDINLNYKGYEHNYYALIKFKNNNIFWANFDYLKLLTKRKELEEKEYKFLELDPFGEEDWDEDDYFKATLNNIKIGDDIYKKINNRYVLMYRVKDIYGNVIVLNLIDKNIDVNIHDYFFKYHGLMLKR